MQWRKGFYQRVASGTGDLSVMSLRLCYCARYIAVNRDNINAYG